MKPNNLIFLGKDIGEFEAILNSAVNLLDNNARLEQDEDYADDIDRVCIGLKKSYELFSQSMSSIIREMTKTKITRR